MLSEAQRDYPEQPGTFLEDTIWQDVFRKGLQPSHDPATSYLEKAFPAIGSFIVGLLVAKQVSAQAPPTIISPPAQTQAVSGIFSFWTIEGSGVCVNTNGLVTIGQLPSGSPF